MAVHSRSIPLILCVDVEPEVRNVDRETRRPWIGLEFLHDFLNEQRRRLEDATGSPVHYSWFLRMDPQVAESWGSPEWVARHYDACVTRFLAEGDEIGLHPHCYRWSEAEGAWYVDDGDQDWINECIRMAYDGFDRVFHRQCESFRMGDGFMNTATMLEIERGGARYELTPEPGSTPERAEFFHERHTGAMPDCRDIPLDPYHPSTTDWRTPDEQRPGAITVIPMSAGFIPREWFPEGRLAPFKRSVKRLLGLREAEAFEQTLNFSCPERFIRHIFDDIIATRANPLLVCSLRTNEPKPEWRANVEAIFDHVRRHARRQDLVIATPQEALRIRTTNAPPA